MDHLITTIGIAFVFIALGVAALGIGWIVTGKTRMKGSCGGRRPKECDQDKSGSCGLCGRGGDDEHKDDK